MVFDIAALIFVLIFSLMMMKKGGMRAILSLGGLVVAIVVASVLYPVVTDVVYKTPLPENLEEIVNETIVIESGAEDIEAIDALPDFMKKAILNTKSDAVESITQSIAEAVTRVIINVIIFVLLIIVTKLIISLATGALDLVTKLPVLNQLNQLVGFGCGLVISLVIVWAATLLAGSLSASNEMVAGWIKDSYVVLIMSNISPF